MNWMLLLMGLLAAGAVVLAMLGTRGAIGEVALEDRTYYDPCTGCCISRDARLSCGSPARQAIAC